MSSPARTKKPVSKRHVDVAIVPGGWGGRLHFLPLTRRLKSLHISATTKLRTDHPVIADVVVTHSVGCLENWEPLAKKAVLILGPVRLMEEPATQATIRRKLLEARWQEVAYQTKNGLILQGTVIFGKAIVESIQDPALMHHQYRLLKKNNFIEKVTKFASQNPKVIIKIIQYKDDVWTEGSLKRAFHNYPNIQISTQADSHDDLLYRPTYYASVIQGLLQ